MQTLKNVDTRPIVVLDRDDTTLPTNLAAYTLNNVIYAQGNTLKTGTYDTAAGNRINVVCDSRDLGCAVDGDGLFYPLSPLDQPIIDGTVYYHRKAVTPR
ncbi:hypothetical protein [Deinococcus wulumuqiensis]|uniref:Uncharacterized protein n=1 Tax=Deinococcus wulumuqiensis TaxID=980427 RepID=A0AAV4K124_9DEIO|nr:hypothetical protein [Deinococcus wulumuqiensis]QII19943.1 hypothetical protein G6R31_03610 [Deinococcus wulumuqiensis R12]GGI74304.1 hypothetical protein GCM10010914_05430 [Deinococcus wulumuqiensis]GGP29857.1 hypothetical protein GCM10008021_15080 [Deinococcus wulumuqiensis]